jgi:geranylgeranyl diphosphate synthase type I
MREAVDTLDDDLRLPVTYHLGWTDENGRPQPGDSGKGIRSALALLGAEAVGASAQQAVPGAVAVELIHNFSLIHDDIMDDDRVRRHRPTVWALFGVGDAIIVGDALHALAFRVLLSEPIDHGAIAATARLARATTAMIAGQARDVALDRRGTATLDECIAMEADKTGALLAQSIAIGALLGEGPPAAVAALEAYGASLGLAFQAVDDVLGIWGDAAQTGKAVGNDLRERKKSMPIAVALDRGGAIAASVVSAYATTPDEQQIVDLSTTLEEAGIKTEVESIARRYLDQAIESLDDADIDKTAHVELVELATFVADRQT